MGGLYTGFESYREVTESDRVDALSRGIVSFDVDVLLNLYRYNDKTVEDILKVAGALGPRLFIPHQVILEFWRSRPAVLAGLGSASREAQRALLKHAQSSRDAVTRWAKSVALPEDQLQEIHERIDDFYENLADSVVHEPDRAEGHSSTSDDDILDRLEVLLEGKVGEPLPEDAWHAAVLEGMRRVENDLPPGFRESRSTDEKLPESTAGEYLAWRQLLDEAASRRTDLVLITADTSENWWDLTDTGGGKGPRRELDEYHKATGHRLVLLEPAAPLRFAETVGVQASDESVEDVDRVKKEAPASVPWTLDAVRAVLRALEAEGSSQARVIRQAIDNGGRVDREEVYVLDNRDRSKLLRGYSRPVLRVTADLQERGEVPFGVPPLLESVYPPGESVLTHMAVPAEVVNIWRTQGTDAG